ncbi:IS4 family transposase [Cylindrospermopsis raciborskii]|uniref:Transposase n=7 Tax=Cylindrospermopsis raciborskii TaxID=77022 RepID=A0A853MGV1_9CYAN|nr:IS4 family transposase [Cylindrospermopsis raciborskii]OBU76368.1 transposase [Cylindrospermopsis raciborskii CS-505]
MLPQSYQKIFRKHLSEQQYLTLEILLLLIQAYRQVKLSKLASLFPQPIKYESRKRNLQRFLGINKLCVKLLWFPLIKYWIRQSLTPQQLNREQRRYFHKKRYQKYGYWMVALDRTQWKGRNIFMVTLVWGTHALPLYWETLNHVGNSNLSTQKRLIKTAIKLLKRCRIVVLADREFHSGKLAKWLDEQGVYFALRQKKDLHFQEEIGVEYQVLKNQGFKPGMSKFYQGVKCGKGDELGLFNIAVYWKRKYCHKGPKEPWYILTNLPNLKQTLCLYRCRWGIEQFFKDCKTGGYNLEDTKVNETRFLALVLLIVIAYSLATMYGQRMKKLGIETYAGRIQQHQDNYPSQSDFSFAVYGQLWIYGMELWADLALTLIGLKPHKRLFFQRGFQALSLIKQAV